MDWKVILIWSLIAFVAGLVVGAKWVNTADTKVTFRKIKVKGEANTALPDLKLSDIDPPKQKKRKLLSKIFKRKNGNSKETQ